MVPSLRRQNVGAREKEEKPPTREDGRRPMDWDDIEGAELMGISRSVLRDLTDLFHECSGWKPADAGKSRL